MRLRISPTTGLSFGLMQQPQRRNLLLQISVSPAEWSMKWVSNYAWGGAATVLCEIEKQKE
jgi:hypothetical protein